MIPTIIMGVSISIVVTILSGAEPRGKLYNRLAFGQHHIHAHIGIVNQSLGGLLVLGVPDAVGESGEFQVQGGGKFGAGDGGAKGAKGVVVFRGEGPFA